MKFTRRSESNIRSNGAACCAALLVLLMTGQVHGQCAQQKLTASDGLAGDDFGQLVSISGTTAFVSAQGDTPGPSPLASQGSVYVYTYDGLNWIETQKLRASDLGIADSFGSSVAVSGDVAIVGARDSAPPAPSYQGAAYVFRFDGTSWVEEQKLTSTDIPLGGGFGSVVSISGDTAMIGAPSDTPTGAVYFFEFDGSSWNQTQRIAGHVDNEEFGRSVHLNGSVGIAGAPGFNIDSGAAYVYRFDGTSWVEEPRLTASDAAPNDDFGTSVSISGNAAVVGAPNDDHPTAGSDTGSAYVFRHNGTSWVEESKLSAPQPEENDIFGSSVSVSGDMVVVGAKGADQFGTDSGSALVFLFGSGGWLESRQLNAADAAAGDEFGGHVSADGSSILVGAAQDDSDTGSVHVFFDSLSDTCIDLDCDGFGSPGHATCLNGALDDCDDGNASVFPGSGPEIVCNGLDDDCDPGTPDNLDGDSDGVGHCFDCDDGDASRFPGNPESVCSGVDADCDPGTFLGPSGFDSDCNGNGLADECDFIAGPEQDCDASGVPDVCEPDMKLLADNGSAGDWFGWSTLVSGDTAIVGAHRTDRDGVDSGSAYVYRFDGITWIQEQELTPTDATADDQFGHAVAITGNTAVVGAPGLDDHVSDGGGMYIFEFDGTVWQQVQKVTVPEGPPGASNGHALSMSGNVIVMARNQDDPKVYRHNGSSWSLEDQLGIADVTDDWYGNSVSVVNDVAIVGAFRTDLPGLIDAGAAHIFRWNGGTQWSQESQLSASDATIGDEFGNSVSISGDWAVVGAHRSDAAGASSGAVYIFHFDGVNWVESQKILPPGPNAAEVEFGTSVFIDGDRIAVGAKFTDGVSFNNGSVHLYRLDGSTWVAERVLTAADGDFNDYFGSSVSLSGDTAVIGAFLDDDNSSSSGSAYVYRLVAPGTCIDNDCDGFPVDPACSNGLILDCDDEDPAINPAASEILCNAVDEDCNPATINNPDGDGDGQGICDDCNDDDPTIYPGNTEITCNGIDDDCSPATSDAPGGVELDCNLNGLSDECDLILGTSTDCNLNGIPDLCDLDTGTSLDVDTNDVPDECALPLLAPGDALRTSRYLRVDLGASPTLGAPMEVIRVRILSLDGFEIPATDVLYAGPPFDAPEEDTSQPGLTFRTARLQCAPYAHSWSTEGIVAIYGGEIMPGSTYEVQRASSDCPDLTSDACWSAPLLRTTTLFGDIVEPFIPVAIQVNFLDINAGVQKFLGAPSSPIKAAAQLQPNVALPSLPISFRDVSAYVEAFLGKSYADMAFSTGPCVCPSPVICNATSCASSATCGGGVCIDGSCHDACGRCTP